MPAHHARKAVSIGLLPFLLLPLAACRPHADPVSPGPTQAPATAPAIDLVARGEYLARIAGCNDCHTDGYTQRQGEVPQAQWLTGSPMGYHGPWGTTYATNLRLRMQELDEVQWLEYSANLHTRPIMPDFNVRAMSEEDRRALYRFIRGLGPAGQPAPEALPPGQAPPPPYFALVLPPAPPETAAASNAH